MKRVLVFLALVAAGLAVVLWLERVEEPPVETPPPAPEPVRPATERPQGSGITPGGAFQLRAFAEGGGAETQPLRFEIRARESTLAEGNVWELEDVEAELYDPLDHTLQVRLKAETGQARGTGQGVEYPPQFEERLLLRGVEAEVLSGVPVVPLVVRSPSADLRLAERTVSSDDTVEIDGGGLTGHGKRWFVDLDSGALSFADGGELLLRRADGTTAAFEAAGAMRLFHAENERALPRPPLVIEGTGGSHITLGGDSAPELTAERILLRGEALEDAGAGLGIRSAEMEGDVVWRSGPNEFRGRRATASFDREGELESAQLEGLPSARLFVPADSELAAEELPSGALRVGGEGPLELTWRDGLRFTMHGPATVESEGTDLRSNGDLAGWMDRAGEEAGFTAAGGVVLEAEGAQLETAELGVTIGAPREEGGEAARELHAVSQGGARFLGELEDGTPFSLTSPDRLEVVRRGGSWSVVESTDIALTVEGASGFQASAARVVSFEVDALSLEAEGGVRFETELGAGSGERLVMRGPEHLTLEGTPQEKAVFEGPGGRAEARFVEREGARLHARGDVRADLSASATPGLESVPGERYEIACDDLVALRDEDGTRRAFSLDATGAVDARAFSRNATTSVRSETLSVRRTWEAGGDASTRLEAEGQVSAGLVSGDDRLDLQAQSLRIEGLDRDASRIDALGGVHFEGRYGIDFGGRGERLVLDETGDGRLTPLPGERVEAHGSLDRHGLPFSMTADEILFREGGAMHATQPEIQVQARPQEQTDEASSSDRIRATARTLDATREAIELGGDVRLDGTTRNGVEWTLEAARARFEGELPDDPTAATLRGLVASGGVSFQVGDTARAVGDDLEARTLFGTMRLTGSPARITSPTLNLEAEWIEFDPELQIVVATGPGTILPNADATGAAKDDWSLEYISSRTLVEPDSFVFALQEPVLHHPASDGLMRASWAVLWIDRQGWPRVSGAGGDAARELRFQPEETIGPLRDGPMGSLFGTIATSEISGLLRELYFEGPIELTSGEYLIGRADAMYLDAVSGHGWIANATVNVWGHLLGQDFTKLVVKADWLRYSADGSMRADSATVTPCDYDEPHVRVVTGNLSLRPGAQAQQFELALQDNRIELFGLITIPLPPIKIGTDEEYSPLWQTLRLANSARFGTLVSAGIVRPAGRVGQVVNSAFRGNPFDYDAKYRIRASYLGLRGILLDLGLEVQSKDKYWLDMYVGGLPDRGEDRGFIQVGEDERDTLRLWYRANSRYLLDEDEWVDLSLTLQTDPGVQSEFFESDFLDYEQSENYLRWRKANDGRFYDVSLKKRLEPERSQIEELPSAGAYVGRTPVADLGPVPLLYMGSGRAEYLRRRAGEDGLQSPFLDAPQIDANGFVDGLGNRDVLRVDTEHRLEAPISLGAAGLRATPFVGARATAWDEGQDPTQSPTRLRAEGGLRLSTTLWKRTAAQTLHQIVPFVQFRGQLAQDRQGGAPVPFDEVEIPVQGNFVELGARGRFGVSESKSLFDVELRGAYAGDLAPGQEAGWQPTAVFARLEVAPWGRPLEIWHDGRYDLADGEAIYSLSSVATRIGEDLRLEASHHRGLDAGGNLLFEAASVRGAYRWTEKWEFEGQETFSLVDNQRLDTHVVVRRYGHDVVFELETSVRAGEGGTSFGISVQPRFGYKPPRVGYLNY